MGQITSGFGDKSLATKLFVFSSILIIVPLLVVGIISYHQSAVELEDEVRQFSWQVMKQVETHVEYYVQDLEIISLKILNHPDVISLSRLQIDDEGEQARRSLTTLLNNAAYSRPDISNITIVVDGVMTVASNTGEKRELMAQIRDEWWYRSIANTTSPVMFTRILEVNGRNEPVMTLARRIYSPQTLEPVGVLLIDVNYRRIREIAEQVTVTKKGYFFIIDSEGHYVYHPQEYKLGNSLENLNFSLFTAAHEGKALRTNKGLDFLTFSSSSYLGWHFVTSIPYLELNKTTGRIGETVLLTTLLTLAMAYVLGVFFAASILRPIRRLQYFMKLVEKGDFSARVLVENNDELGHLSRGFNKMVERLNEMVEEIYFSKLRETEGILRQKEMELKVLQSQINPHFLYNSLETIRGMALERDAEDIATMSASLGQLLRYNLRNQLPVVPLREEIRFSQIYLQIQEFRFEGQFSYELSIPDWAWDLPVVKFSLQPILENCFTHGMGFSGQPLVITLSVEHCDDETFSIHIHDNGTGIEPDVLERIRLDLKQRDVTAGGASIGLINVHRRIVRMYEGNYGLKVDSSPGGGTTVTLRLPVRPVMKEGESG